MLFQFKTFDLTPSSSSSSKRTAQIDVRNNDNEVRRKEMDSVHNGQRTPSLSHTGMKVLLL